jgi:peptidoglycan pentaglycine glycine transferase (the first glycine)
MLREITDQKEWNELYSQAKSASGKFLQSWDWGEFQRSVGRKVIRFADDTIIAQIIELPLPFNKKYWFCPKGPIPAIQDSRFKIHEFLKELKNKVKGAGVFFLRIEPADVIASGAKQSHDISPRCTTIVDLSKSEDELLSLMHQKTRYNIKVAVKHGVAVGTWSMIHSSFDDVWNLFSETATRDGFHLHPREYYEKQIKMPGVEVFTAEHEGKILAAAIVIFSDSTATYLHGASSNEMRNMMAPYALHWEIIKKAKERRCTEYDLWGISDNPKSGWAGITRFKRGWGGTDFCAPGTIDLPVNRFWYSVYRLARRMRP